MTELAARPVSSLRGVGPSMTAKLAGAGIEQVQDLLFHLPLRYQDRTRITPIGALQEGSDAVVEGELRVADIAFGKRRSLVCRIQDGTGTLTLRFFHFSAAQKRNLEPGCRLRCYGEVRRGSSGLEIYHPEYRKLEPGQEVEIDGSLTPVYPTTAGISQASWRKLCGQAVAQLAAAPLDDLLPPAAARGMDLVAALQYLHAPPPDAPQELIREGRHPAQLRLALEELVAHNLSLEKLRRQLQSSGAPDMSAGEAAVADFMGDLAFSLTAAQSRVVQEISADLARGLPMLRLVQGDVGSGKTVVAACAAQQVMHCGYQVAIMAPTEILAEQHAESFAEWFAPRGTVPCLLTGRVKGNSRKRTLELISTGAAQLIIGTHALFQEDVVFRRLGLVIVDEQHRFPR